MIDGCEKDFMFSRTKIHLKHTYDIVKNKNDPSPKLIYTFCKHEEFCDSSEESKARAVRWYISCKHLHALLISFKICAFPRTHADVGTPVNVKQNVLGNIRKDFSGN